MRAFYYNYPYKGVRKVAKVNWEELKTEYITTDISQRKLAAKYGIGAVAISTRSKVEGWVEARKQYKAKTLAKTLEKSSTREANRLARLMDTTTKAIDVAVKAFEDESQFNRYLVDRREAYASPLIDEDGETAISERSWTEEKVFSKVDTKALKDLTSVLKDLTSLMRDFYNIPTPAQAEAQRIAAERLELDRLKATASKETADDIEVIFNAGPEEWNE